MKFKILSPDEMPQVWVDQVVAMFKKEWPHGFTNENEKRDWIHPSEDSPTHLVAYENERVLSHISILHRNIEGANVYGFSGVISHPEIRGRGVGYTLGELAVKELNRLQGDLTLFCCQNSLVNFYLRLGMEHFTQATLYYGEPSNPQKNDEAVVGQIKTARGASLANTMNSKGLYFGSYLW